MMADIKRLIFWFLPTILAIGCGAQMPEVHDCDGFSGVQCPDDGLQYICYKGLCDENPSDCFFYCQVEADCDTSRSMACPSQAGTAMTCGDYPGDSCFPQDGHQGCDELCEFEQPCDPRFACTENYAPVCGSDGVTYENECFLNINRCVNPNILMVSVGTCPEDTNTNTDIDTVDTETTEPGQIAQMPEIHVCGAGVECPERTDGLNYVCYDGLCTEGTAGCLGYCQVEADCDTSRSIVCPSEMYTEMQCGDNPSDDCVPANGDQDCDESCTFQKPCNPNNACMQDYTPVCGSDNLTYQNACWLRLHRCINPNILMKSEGECVNTVDPSQPCVEIYKPVCGSNGDTYENECLLMNAHATDDTLTKVADMTCNAFRESQGEGANATSPGAVVTEGTKIAVTIGVIGGVVVLFSVAYLVSRRLKKRGNSTATDAPRNTPYAEVDEA